MDINNVSALASFATVAISLRGTCSLGGQQVVVVFTEVPAEISLGRVVMNAFGGMRELVTEETRMFVSWQGVAHWLKAHNDFSPL